MPPPTDLNIIDRFMEAFIAYIDSGFGLLGGDVAFLTTVLIGIDITLAGLWWAMDGEREVIARFIKKILYIGIFALILNNFPLLANIVFASFSGLGITAGGGDLTPDQLLRPGYLAGVGFEAAHPLIERVGELSGFPGIFGNFMVVSVLLIAWCLVVLAFFILAIQLFITIIEFKLTTLAGFVLVPFALFNKTSFLAERVLGNVVASGIKVMVLAVIVGIGMGLFDTMNAALGEDPDVADAMTLVLGALALLGLGVFGPGIASGLVSGAPQLGAGAAVGTAAGVAIAGAGAAALGARAAGAAGSAGMGAIRAGTALGSAAVSSYQLGQSASGASGVAAGMGGMARAAGGAAMQGARSVGGRIAAPFKDGIERGQNAAWRATAGVGAAGSSAEAGASGASSSPSSSAQPAWAKRLRSEQSARAARQTTMQTIKDGDRPAAGANPSLSERDD